MLSSVALQTGLAIENSALVHHLAEEAAQRQRIDREIEIARQVQERLLPQIYPLIKGLDFAGFGPHCTGGRRGLLRLYRP